MRIIAMEPWDNGSYENQTWPEGLPLPEGYALVPDDLVCEHFPFGRATAEERDGVLTVVAWAPLPLPEPDPEPPAAPTALDRLQAQVTYTAMKTGTLIPGGEGA